MLLTVAAQSVSAAPAIISAIGGGTFILGLLGALYYRRENKKIKGEKVKQSEADTTAKNIKNSAAQLDLFAKMQTMIEQTWDHQQKLSTQMSGLAQPEQIADLINSVEDVKSEIKCVSADLKDVQNRQSLIERYLDGPFHAWIESMSK